MKTLIANANELALRIFKSRKFASKLENEITDLEYEIKKKMSTLENAKADLAEQNAHTADLAQKHEDAMRSLSKDFSTQSRFANSPSEEINRAFSNEILPDLNEIEEV